MSTQPPSRHEVQKRGQTECANHGFSRTTGLRLGLRVVLVFECALLDEVGDLHRQPRAQLKEPRCVTWCHEQPTEHEPSLSTASHCAVQFCTKRVCEIVLCGHIIPARSVSTVHIRAGAYS